MKLARKNGLAQLNKTRAEGGLKPLRAVPRLWWQMYGGWHITELLKSKADPKCPKCNGQGFNPAYLGLKPCLCIKDAI